MYRSKTSLIDEDNLEGFTIDTAAVEVKLSTHIQIYIGSRQLANNRRNTLVVRRSTRH